MSYAIKWSSSGRILETFDTKEEADSVYKDLSSRFPKSVEFNYSPGIGRSKVGFYDIFSVCVHDESSFKNRLIRLFSKGGISLIFAFAVVVLPLSIAVVSYLFKQSTSTFVFSVVFNFFVLIQAVLARLEKYFSTLQCKTLKFSTLEDEPFESANIIFVGIFYAAAACLMISGVLPSSLSFIVMHIFSAAAAFSFHLFPTSAHQKIIKEALFLEWLNIYRLQQCSPDEHFEYVSHVGEEYVSFGVVSASTLTGEEYVNYFFADYAKVKTFGRE